MQNSDKVTAFFKEICAIPHASYDEKRISDYLVDFAQKRGLEVHQDEKLNVLIKKPASIPNCKSAPLIIQGHMDMVYVRAESCTRTYEDGIAVVEKDGWLCADGTTLGADNGIAVAYALALLDSEDIPHPDLEIVITVEEEVGLTGAAAFDYSQLKGKYYINLDTEDEGVFYTSCAGAFRNDLEIPVERETVSGKTALSLTLGGLKSGHSGMAIHLGRGNAIVLMVRMLDVINWEVAHLASLSCNGKMNAIAASSEAVLYVDNARVEEVISSCEKMLFNFNHELSGIDVVTLKKHTEPKTELSCYTALSRRRVLSALLLMPNGALNMSHAIPGLVETSNNLGELTQREKSLVIASCARSSVASKKNEVARRIEAVAYLTGGESVCSSDYPQWEYRENSPLRAAAMESYRELFGGEPQTAAIHAGLECGYFDDKIKDLDLISFGPDQRDVHTPQERVRLASIENTWQLLCRLLEKLAKGE